MGILMKRMFWIILPILLFTSPSWSATYYVDKDSVGGVCNNSNAGTLITAPWCTIAKANTTLLSGDTVYIRIGTYTLTGDIISPTNSGTVGNVITYSAYTPNGTDFEAVTIQGVADLTGYNSRGIALDGDSYIKITRLTFTNLQKYLYIVNSGHHNEISYCIFQNMRDVWGDIVESGTATNTDSSPTVLQDSTKNWTVNAYVSRTLHNITDGSKCYQPNSNTSNTITCTSYPLYGGTNNYWSNGDSYKITYTISWAGSYVYYNSTHNWIHHNTFTNYGAYSSHDEGVLLEVGMDGSATDASNYNTIENNYFYSAGHHVLGVNTCKNCVIRNNYAHNEGWYTGGKCATFENGKCGYRVVSANVVNTSVGGYSLWEGNKIGYGAAYGGPHLGATGASGSGTTLATPSNIYRYNSHFFNAMYGLRLASSISGAGSNNLVYNNTFYKNGYGADDDAKVYDDYRCGLNFYGDTCAKVSGTVIKNNLFYDQWSETHKLSEVKYYPAIYAVNATVRDTCSPPNVITNNYVDSSSNYLGSATILSGSADPLFVNPDITTPLTTNLPNLNLQSSSPAINGGTYLTTVHADDIGSGTELKVVNARYFQDGTWGSSLAGHVADVIAIGTVDNIVQISSINYSTNTINLASTKTRIDGDSIWLYKKSDGLIVLYGSLPDYGAYEYAYETDITAPVMSVLSPTDERPCTPAPTATVTIGLTTTDATNPVTCKFDLSNTTYALMGTTFSTTGGNSHSHILTGLACTSSHIYYVRCQDAVTPTPNTNTVSGIISFTTATASDTTAPTLSSAVLGTDGRTLTINADESVKFGAGGNTGFTITPSGTAATVSYSYGDYSTALVYITSRVILSTETLTLSYTQPGNGVEDNAGNDKTTFSNQAVTNNSTQAAVTGLSRTLWHSGVTVGSPVNDAIPTNLGVRFSSTVAGVITGIRFYKQANDTGTHIGNIWNSSGLLKGSVTFTGETGSGWQQMSFATPIHINANTLYIASYFCPTGNYTSTLAYFVPSGVSNSPLYSPQSIESVNYNGVYLGAGANTFPVSGSPSGRNFWVDIVFEQRQAVTIGAGSQTITIGAGSLTLSW